MVVVEGVCVGGTSSDLTPLSAPAAPPTESAIERYAEGGSYSTYTTHAGGGGKRERGPGSPCYTLTPMASRARYELRNPRRSYFSALTSICSLQSLVA